ncbi:MAG: hypothetical protein H7066_20150, partial [Cytophagaceae bacterium]|nr:hypothetical protein [Gemmatimonadaceae bacterium]
MLRLRRHGKSDVELGATPRAARATVVSIVLHAALFVGLWNVLQFPRAITFLMGDKSAPTTERLRFLTVAPPAVVVSAAP